MQANPVQTEKAVKALLAHQKKFEEKGKAKVAASEENAKAKGKGKAKGVVPMAEDLMDDDEYVWLMVGFRKIPESSNDHKPRRILLKHRVYKEGAQVCLLTKDPQRTFKDVVKEKKIDSVGKVIGISKLKAKYKPFEAKRQLCNAFDLFLADDSIVHFLPKALGKSFFQKKKNPVAISMKPSTLDKEVMKALSSTYLFLGQGSTSTLKVGRTSQPAHEIVENIADVTEALAKILPKKGQNVQSLSIKTSRSISLPIYNKAPAAPAIIQGE